MAIVIQEGVDISNVQTGRTIHSVTPLFIGSVPEFSTHKAAQHFTTLAVSELEEHAAMGRSAVRYSTVSSGDEALDVELWKKTNAEVEKGWFVGPLSWDDLPETAVVSKRFPLMQGSKLRPMDDYSRSQVNSAISIYDQVTTDGVDVVAAMVAFHMKKLSEAGQSTKLVGRSLDLSSAYRQLCICCVQPFYEATSSFQTDKFALWFEGGSQRFHSVC